MTQLSAAVAGFDRTTALVADPERPGEFAVELDPGWSSLVGIHGGYMSALTVRAAEAVAGPDRVVRTATTSFLRTGKPGPATVVVRTVRAGRALTTATADLVQDGRILVASRLSLLTERHGIEWTERAPIDVMPVDQCVRIETEVGHFDMADGWLDPRSVPFTNGTRARVSGYIRPLEPRPIDSAWLTMASDWFPPPAFVRVAPPTGGVSIDLTTHVHRPGLVLGDDEWLTAEFSIQNSTGGLAVEHGRVTTLEGTVVAESFQTRLTAQS
ncbi:MAG: thioesterase family protein [Acidimicrobiales bacterium]|nr:thioesterase family protein [Acidimicrobiales bacterium]